MFIGRCFVPIHPDSAPSGGAQKCDAPASAHVNVRGLRVFLDRRGKGRPILYLHSDRGGAWNNFLGGLSSRYDVLAPDHPAFGRSDVPDWFDNIHDLAYFYLDFLEQLKLTNVHIVGAGLGGWIACEVAIRSTQRLASLTLIDSYGLRVVGTKRPDVFLWTREETVRNLYNEQSFADATLAKEMTDEDLDLYNKTRHAAARVGWAPRFYDPHLAKWTHRIDIPTLIAWGREDKLLPVSYAEEFKRAIPHAELAIFDRSGHVPHIEELDNFTTVLDAFIKGTGK